MHAGIDRMVVPGAKDDAARTFSLAWGCGSRSNPFRREEENSGDMVSDSAAVY